MLFWDFWMDYSSWRNLGSSNSNAAVPYVTPTLVTEQVLLWVKSKQKLNYFTVERPSLGLWDFCRFSQQKELQQ
jgi:hypothetical protein